MPNVIRQIERKVAAKFAAAAETIPDDIKAAIRDRAVEAVASDEVHKITGGWVALPWQGSGLPVIGLLELASRAIAEAQVAADGRMIFG
jgi:hypothetical protein